MKNKRNSISILLKSALLVSAFFAFSPLASAQKDILELLPGAERLGYSEKLGAHRLVGNVNFLYQGNKMYCDSAHYFDKTQEVRAYGHVQVNKRDTLNLFCDSLYYNGRTKKAKLWGNVRVRDNEYKLTTDSLDYDASKGQAVYRNRGRVESISSPEVLTSRVGYFYPSTKDFFFKGDVVYRAPDLSMTTDTLQYRYSLHKVFFYGKTDIFSDSTKISCRQGWYDTRTEEAKLVNEAQINRESQFIYGDTLYYRPKDSLYIGIGNVRIRDTTEKLELRGNYAYDSEPEKRHFITSDALALKQLDKDTFYIHADTLFRTDDTLGLKLTARAHVQFFKTDMQGRCDTLVYSDSLKWAEMRGRPIVWAENAELKGEFMKLYMNDSTMERVEITGDALGVTEVDSGAYYNQIFGKRMDAWFSEGKLRRTDVSGNAITLYYPEETSKSDTAVVISRKGFNRLFASDIRIYLDSGEVVGVTYLDQPDGVFYPMNRIKKEEQFLDAFSWKAIIRPKNSADILIDKDPDDLPEPLETPDEENGEGVQILSDPEND